MIHEKKKYGSCVGSERMGFLRFFNYFLNFLMVLFYTNFLFHRIRRRRWKICCFLYHNHITEPLRTKGITNFFFFFFSPLLTQQILGQDLINKTWKKKKLVFDQFRINRVIIKNIYIYIFSHTHTSKIQYIDIILLKNISK